MFGCCSIRKRKNIPSGVKNCGVASPRERRSFGGGPSNEIISLRCVVVEYVSLSGSMALKSVCPSNKSQI
jgi:hypothetical protein